jgi:hypothetical protein
VPQEISYLEFVFNQQELHKAILVQSLAGSTFRAFQAPDERNVIWAFGESHLKHLQVAGVPM